jgi:mannose-6-phosphate isomerase-like protein (cupin superfamily)
MLLPGSRGSLEIRTGALACLAALLFLGCARLDSSIVGHYSGDLALQDWRTIAKMNQPERGEILRIVDAGRSNTLSNHIVVVRSRELPHRHNRHDSTVMLLQGRGTIVIGKESKRVRPGAVLFIPRGTIHHFTNGARKPSVALVVFSPPFDGQDREVVRPPAAPAATPTEREPIVPAPGPDEGGSGTDEGAPVVEQAPATEAGPLPTGPPDAVDAPEVPPESRLPGEPPEEGGVADKPRPSPGAVIESEAAPEPRMEPPDLETDAPEPETGEVEPEAGAPESEEGAVESEAGTPESETGEAGPEGGAMESEEGEVEWEEDAQEPEEDALPET